MNSLNISENLLDLILKKLIIKNIEIKNKNFQKLSSTHRPPDINAASAYKESENSTESFDNIFVKPFDIEFNNGDNIRSQTPLPIAPSKIVPSSAPRYFKNLTGVIL